MTQTQKMIDNSKKEIELYITEMLGSSVDAIELMRTKMDIHKNVIYALKEQKINDLNEKHYEEISKILDGIRKIKGETPLYLINDKVSVLIDHINFIQVIEN